MDQCEYLCSLYLWLDDTMLVKWSEAYSLSREMLVDIYTVCLYFIWHLHCISFIALAYGVMSRTYGSDRTGTTLFIGHNDAASYLVGYEGRRHGIALHGIAFALWIWDVSGMSWSMALGDIGKKWSLTKDWWRLISSFTWLYHWIRYILLLLFGSLVLEI